MKQLKLLDVPPDSPTRQQRINEFKAVNRIWTFHHDNMTREDNPWTGLLLPDNPHVDIPYKDDMNANEPLNIIANYCSVLDDLGFLVEGTGELDVIRKICANINIEPPM